MLLVVIDVVHIRIFLLVWPSRVTCRHVTLPTISSEGHSSFGTTWDGEESVLQQKKKCRADKRKSEEVIGGVGRGSI